MPATAPKRPRINLAGQRFHSWVVLQFSHSTPRKRQMRWHWLCRCDCGTVRTVMGEYLIGEQSKSCGCYRAVASHSRRDDLVGQVFGRRTVIKEIPFPGKTSLWLCHCECGREQTLAASVIRSNGKSCGCFKSERTSQIKRKHGLTGQAEHRIWNNMLNRCRNKKMHGWPNYGGRGIKVCERWGDFQCFLADMGERPSDKHSIDRVDVNGDYEPGNCRWATPLEQNNNRRTNVFVTAQGKTQTLAQWARDLGCGPEAIKARIWRGLSPEEAVTRPLAPRFRKK